MPDESSVRREFERQKAERRRIRVLDQAMRLECEAAIRLVLDEYYPAGIPADLVERICLIQNKLIRQITRGARPSGDAT